MRKPTTYPIVIEQQDTDCTYRASITTIIGKVLNVAGLDANSKGFGVDILNKKSYSWVLSRFSIEMDYLPKAFDRIEITTWINDCNRLMSTRNFIVYNSEGAKIGEAVSQWCMIDLNSRKAVDLSILNILQPTYGEYVLGSLDASIERPHKIPNAQSQTTHNHRAVYTDIDFNKHVNSLRYIDLMLDILPLEALTTPKPLRVDLQYIRESYYGDTLHIKCEKSDNNTTLFEITRDDNIQAAKCKIEWR